MLPLLLCLLLSCWAPSCSNPVPRAAGLDCLPSSLLQEALSDVQKLKGSREITPPNNITLRREGKGNAIAYLEEFIKALEGSRGTPVQKMIAQKLQRIQAKNCTGWLKYEWEPEEDDFFSNLNNLLLFLNHYGFSEETT